MTRYALYYAPLPDHPLWPIASSILGYDAATGADRPFPPMPDALAADWPAYTEDPRRYGFHATLKAPMPLAATATEADVIAAAAAFAAGQTPITVELALTALGRFLALTPATPSPAINALAAATVEYFEPLRGPLDAADRARRVAAGISARELELLDQWGYPHIFELFQYHMTLTGRLPVDKVEDVRIWLAETLAPYPLTISVDHIAIFVQPDRASRFRILAQFPFGG
jgi:putative phosphonate metabolism protein